MGQESANTTIDIAPGGDLVFIVGPTEKRLKVHSLFVRTASPVMDAMLGPYFDEGQRLGEFGMTEIAFPEDDADAIETIFNVIHGRNDKVSQTLSPSQILQIAIATDKYDCSVSLTFAIQSWLKIPCVNDPQNLWALAMAASVFGDQDTFGTATSMLVFHHAGSYLELAGKQQAGLDPVLPFKTAALLEGSRNSLRMSLIRDVLNGDWHCSAVNKKTRHRPDWLTKFMQRTSNFENRTLADIMDALEPEKALSVDDDFTWSSSVVPNLDNIFKTISANLRKKQDDPNGLCLWCVKQGDDHAKHVEQQHS